MSRRIAVVAIVATILSLAGCALFRQPTYAEVRQETLDAMDHVASLMTDHGRVERTPEFEPYGCGDPLIFGSGRGAFYTGQWTIAVADDFDVDQFVDSLPALLADEWTEESLGVPVREPYIYLVRKSPRMTLSVQESSLDGGKAVELLAISRCGAEEPETDEPARQ